MQVSLLRLNLVGLLKGHLFFGKPDFIRAGHLEAEYCTVLTERTVTLVFLEFYVSKCPF